ncbi:MAG: C4-type zinc ribbon domain-containing protein [Prevotellaceae bacterium]|jgi:predicted  nucleic acid-binding Zn-ribbon protein|nr:C4-type zinc ribbon domain-containing protein [Prevotellaceae bacterium]
MATKKSETTETTRSKKSAAKKAQEALDLPEISQREKEDILIVKLLAKSPTSSGDSTENKLRMLYEMQLIDSEIDKIKILRGELPLEVQDLEDEIAGLETRMANFQTDIKKLETDVTQRKIDIENSKGLVKKYEEQQKNVRNNREFDSLSKEIEFQGLEVELAEKKIKEANAQIKERKLQVEDAKGLTAERKTDLELKQKELADIVTETSKEETDLINKSIEYQSLMESRLLIAYSRLRKNAQNGLAVVPIRRDACGGCFNKIPPQRQMDIKLSKKIIVCEYCGRILVDSDYVWI